jgi:6-phosphogluconolactonase (cycloisomerase 2 family)
VPQPTNNVAGFAYVANAGSNDISAYAIDAATGALSKVAGSPFAAGINPKSVTVLRSGKFAYVANFTSNNVSAFTINAATGTLTSVGAAVAAGIRPNSITITGAIR